MSSEENKSGHKRTKRVSECELPTLNKDDDEDPIITKLNKIGCLEKHYAVQDCYFETKDWRKCSKEVKEFQECVKQAKEESN